MEFLHVTTSRHDGTVTVTVSGELDIATTELLRGRLLWLLQESGRAQAVVLDLRRLSFIDAAGLGVLVALHDQARRRRTPLRLTGVPPAMRRLLRVTGLDAHLDTIGADGPHR
ncbi:MAG TPA: STAS domain-containing protein [Nonomuraea sp.]|nr:STAS domain-containing protein [Nonomuraea sp.]